MPKLTIDQREVEVPEGATILDAARGLGIDIPTLCHREGCEPSTSCLACLVRVGQSERLVPSCATAAVDGMEVESETDAVRQARLSALELLLSDHLGDCLGPCQLGCPAEMDIPTMLRQIAAGDLGAAIATIKRDIALPAILGRICPAPCEKICRRRELDQPVSICLLKRLAADVDLAFCEPYTPPCAPPSGKHVAIVGGGPTGLSAAYYLRRHGHACTLFDENERLGGRLLRETTEDELPRAVLDAEIGTILQLGVKTQLGFRLDLKGIPELLPSPADRLAVPGRGAGGEGGRFDAVLLASGATGREQAINAGLPVSQRGIQTTAQTYCVGATAGSPSGIFAAGNAIRTKGMVVRSVADGKEAARAIHQYLSGQPVTGWPRPFNTKIGRMTADELAQYAAAGDCPNFRGHPAGVGENGTVPFDAGDPAGGLAAGLTPEEGVEQAARCLHCDCRGLRSCKLRQYAEKYHANPRHYEGTRRTFQVDARHADVIFEPGKCIDCGLCIQIAARAGEPLGLTFVGRGFDVRVSVPLNRSLAEALTKTAAECVAACPTGALAHRDHWPR